MTLNYLHVSADIEHRCINLFTIFISNEEPDPSSPIFINLLGFAKAVRIGNPIKHEYHYSKAFNPNDYNFRAPETMEQRNDLCKAQYK
jgi:hypothetical protein